MELKPGDVVILKSGGTSTTGAGTEPAWAFIWRGDFWNRPAQRRAVPDFSTPLADGAVQVGELGLLEYDPAAGVDVARILPPKLEE